MPAAYNPTVPVAVASVNALPPLGADVTVILLSGVITADVAAVELIVPVVPDV